MVIYRIVTGRRWYLCLDRGLAMVKWSFGFGIDFFRFFSVSFWWTLIVLSRLFFGSYRVVVRGFGFNFVLIIGF